MICPHRGCGAKFIYKQQLESHLVREHGGERKHTCEYCGQRFIQKSHYNRHVRIYHVSDSGGEVKKLVGQKRRERGPNRTGFKKNLAFVPPGMVNATITDTEMGES